MPGQSSGPAELVNIDGEPMDLSRRTTVTENGQETVVSEAQNGPFEEISGIKTENFEASKENSTKSLDKGPKLKFEIQTHLRNNLSTFENAETGNSLNEFVKVKKEQTDEGSYEVLHVQQHNTMSGETSVCSENTVNEMENHNAHVRQPTDCESENATRASESTEEYSNELVELKVPKIELQTENINSKGTIIDHKKDMPEQKVKIAGLIENRNPGNKPTDDTIGEDMLMFMNTELHQLPQHKLYSCGVCGEQFESPWVLKEHMNIHSDKVYACEFCPIQFRALWQLKQHRLVHSEKSWLHKVSVDEHESPLLIEQNISYTNSLVPVEYGEKKSSIQKQGHKRKRSLEHPDKKTMDGGVSSDLTEEQLDEMKAIYKLMQDGSEGNSARLENLKRKNETLSKKDESSSNNEQSNEKSIEDFKTHLEANKGACLIEESGERKIKHSSAVKSEKSGKGEIVLNDKKMVSKLESDHENDENKMQKSVDILLEDAVEHASSSKEDRSDMTEHVPDPELSGSGSDTCKDKSAKPKSAATVGKKTKHDSNFYSCGICGKQFRVPHLLRTHMVVHSEDRPFSCEKCPSKFKSRWLLKQHALVHTDEKPYSCEICSSTFKSSSILKQHVRKHSDERPFECEICDSKFKSRWLLKQHKMVHSDIKPFPCIICDSSFKTKWRLKQHVLTHTNIKPYACEICLEDFESESDLTTHMDVHTGEQEYACEICGNNYKSAQHLKQHALSHAGETQYSCELCEKHFSQRSELKAHMLEHTGQRNLACEICDKTFLTVYQLRRHTLSHAEEKPHPCCICERTFVTKAQLDRHILTHTGEKNFVCEICEKRFITNGDLSEHMNTHTGQKLHACYICCKMFAKLGNLNRHLQSHAGVRPFKCEICDKSFSTKAYIRAHARVHSGEKPFSCEVCGKTFTMTTNLSQHKLIHKGIKPHTCKICDKQFTTSTHVKQHMKTHLKKKPFEMKVKRKFNLTDAMQQPQGIDSKLIPESLEIDMEALPNSPEDMKSLSASPGDKQVLQKQLDMKSLPKSLDVEMNSRPGSL